MLNAALLAAGAMLLTGCMDLSSAMTIAQGLGTSFMPFAITVMVGASCSFISPVSYQTNLMVYGPGEYSFGDFVKIGIPLSILVGVITVLLTPIFFPFHP